MGRAILPAAAFQSALLAHSRDWSEARRRLKASGGQDWPPHEHGSLPLPKSVSLKTVRLSMNLKRAVDRTDSFEAIETSVDESGASPTYWVTLLFF